MAAVVVIPARMAATRLPGKPLLNATGKPLVQHVWERARRARRAEEVVIATDDLRVLEAARAFGAAAMLTAETHRSGTDRVAEVAERLGPEVDRVVNVQGDEPEIDPEAIDAALSLLEADPNAQAATLATAIRDPRLRDDPSCVKVVCDHAGRALYFSRCPIPYLRDGREGSNGTGRHLQHVGLYAYRRETLAEIGRLPESPLEQAEGLEQLRWLQAGWSIRVGLVAQAPRGIDTAEDYRRFVDRYRTRYTGTRALSP